MQTDLTPSTKTAAALRRARPSVLRRIRHARENDGENGEATAEKAAPQKWLDDADELFRYLERYENEHALEREGWHRTMSATLALLKHAAMMARTHEKQINELEEVATIDPLTGLMNMNGFFQTFLRELDRARRGYSWGGLLVMVELDNIEAIKDAYGTAAGEEALRTLAGAVKKDIRTMDIAARLSNDEFVILFANTKREKALERAQMMTWALNRLGMDWKGANVPLRIGLGLKEYKAGDEPEEVFRSADLTPATANPSAAGKSPYREAPIKV